MRCLIVVWGYVVSSYVLSQLKPYQPLDNTTSLQPECLAQGMCE